MNPVTRRDIDQQSTPTLQLMPISSLKPDPDNARQHPAAQVDALASSIRTFGFIGAIVIDQENRVRAGHARLEAAKRLGLDLVPVIQVTHLSPEKLKAFMLADNKLGDRSGWDDKKLALQLKELSELTLDFEIEATGFEPPEIDLRIQSLQDSEPDIEDLVKIAEGPTISRLGDLWQLGQNRLLCGDALAGESYLTLLGDEKAAAAFTDPPYNVRIDGHATGKGSLKHREFEMASGEMTSEEFTAFLRTVLSHIRSASAPGALLYICMDWRHMQELLDAGRALLLFLINLCVWAKTNGGMGSLYRSRHELVFVFRGGDAGHVNNVQLGRFGRNRTNVWNYPGANVFSKRGQPKRLELHPTVKPVALVADAILDCTKRGDAVLDPFIGSGTTIIAAERTGRRAYGIELDGQYVDTAIRRWQRLTGRDAKNERGQTFDEVAIERGLS